MESSSNIVQYTKASAVSPETQAIVEQNLPHASDEVKQKTMQLMDATKKQVSSDSRKYQEKNHDLSRANQS